MLQQPDLPSGVNRTRVEFVGADGNRLAGDLFQPASKGNGVVLLLHGGGQTKHAWRFTSNRLAANGWAAIALDQRGHGDSAWVADGDYSFEAYGRDLVELCRQIDERFGVAPVVIGASLGGIASLLVADASAGNPPYRALVLVDITPTTREGGTDHILAFMEADLADGFGSLEEAAEAISRYLPHRPKPRSLEGLRRNLRLHPDGRYRWHWDPLFIRSRRQPGGRPYHIEDKLSNGARSLSIPIMLVRGRESELVGEDEVKEFLRLAPHAKVRDVHGARHMVAGDVNDVFTDTVLDFLNAI